MDIAPGTAAYFGAGHYPGRGITRDRIVIPIHDQGGRLIAYAGRAVQQTGPKYLLPPGFAKSQVLFNLHRAVTHPGPAVISVEGYFDCMKVHQAGFPGVAALMGCCLSERQQHLPVSRAARIVLMLDADLAGLNASRQIAHQLSALRPVHLAALPPGMQPDQMSSDNINGFYPTRSDTKSTKGGSTDDGCQPSPFRIILGLEKTLPKNCPMRDGPERGVRFQLA